MDWLESLLLGVVQGLTEFLPVSSDGHLAITQQAFARLRGSGRSGAENLFFDVMLHLGTLAAILVHYRAVAKTSVAGALRLDRGPPRLSQECADPGGAARGGGDLAAGPGCPLPEEMDRPGVPEHRRPRGSGS